MLNIKQYNYWEHASDELKASDFPVDKTIRSKSFSLNHKQYCFEIVKKEETYRLDIGYYIGVDWLIENHSSIVISPKLNSRIEDVKAKEKLDDNIEIDHEISQTQTAGDIVDVDYFSMLNKCLDIDYLYYKIDNLVHINWTAAEVPIKQNEDWLSPLLIVKFLNLLKIIVKKGLKKSYYKINDNLNSKIKGKILIGQNIKKNVLKNKFTHTVCEYEEFGLDNLENRLIKKAFLFAISYFDNHKKIFSYKDSHFSNIINYSRPAFERISNDVNILDVKNYKGNPFFKEYNEAIYLAKLLLKRFAYSVANTSKEKMTTPPYWIDMPKLFELYSYHFLKSRFYKAMQVAYHFSTYGNELDFLINSDEIKMVVDAKYKPIYIYGKDHQDIRQVSGYSRLEKVYTTLNIKDDQLIDCLIIYPDVRYGCNNIEFMTTDLKHNSVSGYRNVYKVAIKLPVK